MIIRDFKKEDASEVSEIIKENYFKVLSKYYDKNLIDFLIKRTNKELVLKRFLSKRKYFVAEENKIILGVGAYQEDKLYSFFVLPEMQKKGIGTKLMNKVLKELEKKHKIIYCYSVLGAESFYKKFGFKIIEEKIKIIESYEMKFIYMQKN